MTQFQQGSLPEFDTYVTIGVSHEALPDLMQVLGHFATQRNGININIDARPPSNVEYELTIQNDVKYDPRLVRETEIFETPGLHPVVSLDHIKLFANGSSGIDTPDWITPSLGTRAISIIERYATVLDGVAHDTYLFKGRREVLGIRADQYPAMLLSATTKAPKINNLGPMGVRFLVELGEHLVINDGGEPQSNS